MKISTLNEWLNEFREYTNEEIFSMYPELESLFLIINGEYAFISDPTKAFGAFTIWILSDDFIIDGDTYGIVYFPKDHVLKFQGSDLKEGFFHIVSMTHTEYYLEFGSPQDVINFVKKTKYENLK